MTPIFLDTVGLVALWDSADQWHAVAQDAYDVVLKSGAQFFTTTHVLLECGNAAARKPFRDHADDLRQALEQIGQLIQPTDEDWQLAWLDYRAKRVGTASIVDHVSFRVMWRLGMRIAFTNDRHFSAAGFEILF